MKRNVSLLLMLALLVSLCGMAVADDNFNATGYPIAKEPVTYTALVQTGTQLADDWREYTTQKYLSEYTNVYFDFQYITGTDWDTQINLRLVSGDIPDTIITPLTNTQLQTYGEEGGMFLNYVDYIDEYMPNMKTAFEKYPDMASLGAMLNGEIYSLARNVWTYNIGNPMYYRGDMMAEMGAAVPTTIDEFYNLLVAAKEFYSNVEGFYPIESEIFWLHHNLFPAFGDGVQVGRTNQQSGYGDNGDGKVTFNYMTDQWRHYLEFFNKLYKEGLIDKEIFTLDSQAVNAKIKAGQCLFIGNAGTQLTADYYASGKVETKVLAPLVSEFTNEPKVLAIAPLSLAGRVINANCKNPEYLMRYYDMFYTEIADAFDGICGITSWLGLKGTDWDITENGENYFRIMPSDTKGLSEEEYKNKYIVSSEYLGLVVLDVFPINNPTQEMKGYESAASYYPFMKYRLLDGNFKYSEEENSRLSSLTADITTYVDTVSAQFMSGALELNDANWDNYVNTIQSMGIDEVLEIKQAGYDRWLGK
ncbi:MAG TPA: extracellular solute-binding protein [Clostridia bacterium]|nr:extracellular solute-binding protein [Clostridia bacterium]